MLHGYAWIACPTCLSYACILSADVLNPKASLGNNLRTAHEFSGGIHRRPLAYAYRDKEAQVDI